MSTPGDLALPRPDRADPADRLAAGLRRRADGLALSPASAARRAVRGHLQRLRRRRRAHHALALTAGMVTGALQLRPGTGTLWAVSDTGPPSATPGGRPLSHDPDEGIDRGLADPGVVHAAGEYHVYATSAAHCTGGRCHEHRVPRFTSPDLVQPLRLSDDALPELPAWVAADDPAIWAPEVTRVAGRYVLYFAATSGRPADGRMKCLGAAVAAGPEGPFRPRAEPLRCTPGYWAIDPYPVGDDHAGWHLLWRQDDTRHGTGTVVAAPLSGDGLAIAGRPRTLVVGESRWEQGYPGARGIGPIENPAMVRHPATGEWLLTWSANLWETQSYATGLAICAGPDGPCERRSRDRPWVRTSDDAERATGARWGGAGGLSFAVGPGGEVRAVLHAYAGDGRHPVAPRVAWGFRVDVDPGSAAGYRLVELVETARNHSAGSPVNGA